jgi:hypothetical protein
MFGNHQTRTKSGDRQPAGVCGTRSVSIRFCSAPSRLKIENGGPCSTSARQRSQRLRLPHCYAEERGHSSTSARQCSQRLRVEFCADRLQVGGLGPVERPPLRRLRVELARTDCRAVGRWPHLPLAVCRLRVGLARTDCRSTNAVCEVELELEVAGRISARR